MTDLITEEEVLLFPFDSLVSEFRGALGLFLGFSFYEIFGLGSKVHVRMILIKAVTRKLLHSFKGALDAWLPLGVTGGASGRRYTGGQWVQRLGEKNRLQNYRNTDKQK